MGHDVDAQREQAHPARRTSWALVAILLVGAALRGLYLAEIAESPELRAPAFDAAFHDHWARALVTGDWSPPQFFADPEIDSTPYFRPPAYPFFLAAVYAVTGGSPLGARVIQMVLGLVNVWLGFLLGRALFGRSTGLLVAAGMSCMWPFVYFEGELLAPVLLVTLMLTSSLVWHRWWLRGGWITSVGGGLLLGLFALARPTALALLPVVWLWALWVARKRREPGRMRTALLGLPLGALVAIAPATIRNYAVAGDLVLITSNGGVNFYIGNNEETDGYSARIPILDDLAALQGWTCFDQPAIARGVERLEGRSLAASEVSWFFAERALDFIVARPGAALALVVKKAALFWGPAEISNNRQIQIARDTSPVLRWLPTFPWVLSLAVIGALLLARDLRRAPRAHRFDLAVLLAGIALVYFASHLPFFVAGRYRVPILPLLLLAAAYGIRSAAELLAGKRFRIAGAWAIAWLVVLVVAHVPLVDYQPDRGRWHFQRGDAWRMCGDLDRAIDEFRLAIEAQGSDPLPHNNLGAALLRQGKVPDAIESFREAVRLDPEYVHARFNLALALASAGRDDLARPELEEVLRLDPELTPARKQLGALLLRLGLAVEALPHLRTSAEQAPGDPTVSYLYAIALLESGRVPDARAVLEGLVQKAPRFVDAYVVLAEIAERDGERDRAVRLLQTALSVEPGHAAAADLLQRLR